MKKNGLLVTIVAFCAVVAGIIFFNHKTLAPDSTFVLLDGSKKQTTDLRGQVALVNFWATSCVTCVAEMPEVIRTYEKYKGKGENMWADVDDAHVLFERLRELPGFGAEKAQIFVALLGKRFEITPANWKKAAGVFSDSNPRTVADITSPETLLTVRAWKKAEKAADRDKQSRPLK